MENIIAKEFEHISVTIFGPAKISIELCTIYHSTKLGQQSEQPGWFNFFGQFGFNDVIMGESGIQLIVKSRTWNNQIVQSVVASKFSKIRIIWWQANLGLKGNPALVTQYLIKMSNQIFLIHISIGISIKYIKLDAISLLDSFYQRIVPFTWCKFQFLTDETCSVPRCLLLFYYCMRKFWNNFWVLCNLCWIRF